MSGRPKREPCSSRAWWSVASRACWDFQEKVQSVASRVLEVPRGSSERSIKSVLEVPMRNKNVVSKIFDMVRTAKTLASRSC